MADDVRIVIGGTSVKAQAAIKAKWPDKNKRPKGLRNPFRDATEKLQFEGYEEGITFVTASSKLVHFENTIVVYL